LPGDLKKRGASRVAHLWHSIFKEQALLSPANLSASLVLEFHRRESGRGSPTRRCQHGLWRNQLGLGLAAATAP